MPTALDDNRLAPAGEAFSLYDFGDEVVNDLGGWEFVSGQEVWRRIVFFEGSVKKAFVVRFQAKTTEVDEAYVE